jgi:hypothetical protein
MRSEIIPPQIDNLLEAESRKALKCHKGTVAHVPLVILAFTRRINDPA